MSGLRQRDTTTTPHKDRKDANNSSMGHMVGVMGNGEIGGEVWYVWYLCEVRENEGDDLPLLRYRSQSQSQSQSQFQSHKRVP